MAWVPGAFELPLAAMRLADVGQRSTPWWLSGRSSGATPRISTSWPASVRRGSQRAALDTGVPVVFGVLTTDTVDQALEPGCGAETSNKGCEAAVTALEMVRLLRKLPGAAPARAR